MKAINFTKIALEKLKHTQETYRIADQKTTGLSIEVRAEPSFIKTYYAEWSYVVINKEGKQKRHGARRKICRYNQMTIEAVRNNVNLNLANWKRTNTQTGKKKTIDISEKDDKKIF